MGEAQRQAKHMMNLVQRNERLIYLELGAGGKGV